MRFDLVSFGRVFVLKQTMQFHIYVGQLVAGFIWVKIRLIPCLIRPCVISLRSTLLSPPSRGKTRTTLKWGSKERLSMSRQGWRLRKDIKNKKSFKTFFCHYICRRDYTVFIIFVELKFFAQFGRYSSAIFLCIILHARKTMQN